MFARIEIDSLRCKGCGLCIVACPRNLIYLSYIDNNEYIPTAVFSENGHCVGCGFCASTCPDLAIKIFSLYKNEITGKMSKNFSFYRKMVNDLSNS